MSFNGIIALDFWLAFEPLRLHHHTSLSPISTSTSRSWPLRWWPFWSCTSPEKSPTRLSDNIFTFFHRNVSEKIVAGFPKPGKMSCAVKESLLAQWEEQKKACQRKTLAGKKLGPGPIHFHSPEDDEKKSPSQLFLGLGTKKKSGGAPIGLTTTLVHHFLATEDSKRTRQQQQQQQQHLTSQQKNCNTHLSFPPPFPSHPGRPPPPRAPHPPSVRLSTCNFFASINRAPCCLTEQPPMCSSRRRCICCGSCLRERSLHQRCCCCSSRCCCCCCCKKICAGTAAASGCTSETLFFRVFSDDCEKKICRKKLCNSFSELRLKKFEGYPLQSDLTRSFEADKKKTSLQDKKVSKIFAIFFWQCWVLLLQQQQQVPLPQCALTAAMCCCCCCCCCSITEGKN